MSSPLLQTPSSISNRLLEILSTLGDDTLYSSEQVSQLQHSLQCAHLAKTAQPEVDEYTIVAALLHDIGQIIPEEELYLHLPQKVVIEEMETQKPGDVDEKLTSQPPKESVGRVGHEILGARYLSSLGFSEKVVRLVESHVAAKRYLCAIDGSYWHTLSNASKKSLEFQGGPMTDEEKEVFEGNLWCDEMCRLRKWDDSAKVCGLKVPGVDAYQDMMNRMLESV